MNTAVDAPAAQPQAAKAAREPRLTIDQVARAVLAADCPPKGMNLPMAHGAVRNALYCLGSAALGVREGVTVDLGNGHLVRVQVHRASR